MVEIVRRPALPRAKKRTATGKHLDDLAVEVIRLRLRNDYAWARERKRRKKRKRERGERGCC